MKKYWFVVLFLSRGVSAQTTDSFSDGDFTANPAWYGSGPQFIVNNNQQLQLNNSAAGISYLSTSFSAPSLNNMEWHFYLRLNFSPSASNYGRVYLVSDQTDLTRPLNGYYLQFGESGSNDAIELFRQSGSISSSVCRATNGAIATSFTTGVRVERNSSGLWRLEVDYSGNNAYSLEAAGIDSTYTSSSFLGVLCNYTISNATKFNFDDFYAGPAIHDTTPPVLEWVLVRSSNQLLLGFSEALDTISAQSATRYSANHDLGYPQSAILQQDSKSVVLTFAKSFQNGIQNQVSVTGVKDLSGNAMGHYELPFLFFIASSVSPKDIVISEIFPDPDPSIGLPKSEFIEVYNRSDKPILVEGWTLSDGVSTAILSSEIILSQQYWIVTASAALPSYTNYGHVIGVEGFPSLNNSGDHLVLKDPERITIDSVNYSLDYYHDTDKENGGWSMELIDLNNPCGEEDNWTASDDRAGGTPGKQNSVFASKPDLTGPRLLQVVPRNDSLLIMFDEKLDIGAPTDGLFLLTPYVPLAHVSFASRSLNQILIVTGGPLELRQPYQLKVTGVRDCNGNLIQDDFSQLNFAQPEPADSLDIVVNEILFNPRPTGVDFLEIYNRSGKYLNLKEWKLANYENEVLKNVRQVSSEDLLLPPRAYLVFTDDPSILANDYPRGIEKNYFKASLPGLPDDEGSIAVVNDKGRILDAFHYSRNFHSELIKDDEGVSLERISVQSPTDDPQNWKSANAQSGFGTPGYINSNAKPELLSPNGAISVEPEIFVPGSGGIDFALIHYAFDQAGLVANIKIYDHVGHLIRNIANNETLGFEGFYRWDGDREDGSKARIGYYVVWAEIFDFSGNVKTFRKRVIVEYR